MYNIVTGRQMGQHSACLEMYHQATGHDIGPHKWTLHLGARFPRNQVACWQMMAINIGFLVILWQVILHRTAMVIMLNWYITKLI